MTHMYVFLFYYLLLKHSCTVVQFYMLWVYNIVTHIFKRLLTFVFYPFLHQKKLSSKGSVLGIALHTQNSKIKEYFLQSLDMKKKN